LNDFPENQLTKSGSVYTVKANQDQNFVVSRLRKTQE